jgi:2-polyprenyl-3-methyl-5-hydroxy-6-metoxy-1,4-benzoquinol methylase
MPVARTIGSMNRPRLCRSPIESERMVPAATRHTIRAGVHCLAIGCGTGILLDEFPRR